jgi:hypothetical protein
MAIRLEYQTCLFEEAFDEGVKDLLRINEMKRAQEEDSKSKGGDDASAAGDDHHQAPKDDAPKTVFEPKPYLTRKVQLVCCLNTMGQDRKLNEKEKLFALRTVQKYRDRWEASERENLKADIERKVAQQEDDRQYKDSHETIDHGELDRVAEEACAVKEGQDQPTEEQKAVMQKKARFVALTKTFYDPEGCIEHQRQLDRDKVKSAEAPREETANTDEKAEEPKGPKYYPLAPEQWKRPLLDMRQNYIIKHPRVLQTLFYMLGYTREQICERGTNPLDFKLIKDLINEQLFQKMGTYKPDGSRDGEFSEYQKIAFLKENIRDLDEEKVEDFSMMLGKVLQWIRAALELRCEDVVNRRDTVEYQKHERQQAIAASADRQKKYELEIAEAKAAWEEKNAEEKEKAAEGEEPTEPAKFDEEKFKTEFDEANAEIKIDDEPKEEIDNDFNLAYKPPAMDLE